MKESELHFYQRFFYQVYSKKPTNQRRFKNYSDLAFWIHDTLGPRPSRNHFLYLTEDIESPVYWIEIMDWKAFYKVAIEIK